MIRPREKQVGKNDFSDFVPKGAESIRQKWFNWRCIELGKVVARSNELIESARVFTYVTSERHLSRQENLGFFKLWQWGFEFSSTLVDHKLWKTTEKNFQKSRDTLKSQFFYILDKLLFMKLNSDHADKMV